MGLHFRQPICEEIILLFPPVALITFVSSQTGFNPHVRYVLTALPMLYISFARLGNARGTEQRWIAATAALLIGWGVVSSMIFQPHSLSYFNELAGGPKGGYRYLGNSNADWGQDLLYLKKWYESHPNARPLYVRYDLSLIDPKLALIDWSPIPSAPEPGSSDFALQSGWYAISVNELNSALRSYDYFKTMTPVDWVGYSMPLYHVTSEQAAQIRQAVLRR